MGAVTPKRVLPVFLRFSVKQMAEEMKVFLRRLQNDMILKERCRTKADLFRGVE